MKNKFATSRTTRQAMRRVLILASRLSDPGARSVSPLASAAGLNERYQRAPQRISSAGLNQLGHRRLHLVESRADISSSASGRARQGRPYGICKQALNYRGSENTKILFSFALAPDDETDPSAPEDLASEAR